jgi:hypothetical protein
MTCCCFSFLRTNLGDICPRFGCEFDLVEEIKNDLQQRINARGDTGIIRINEEQLLLLKSLDKKLDKVTKMLENK